MEIAIVPILDDNYAYLLHTGGETAVVDPGDAGPILSEAEKRGWNIGHILCTHHHNDHVGGNHVIKAAHGSVIVGPRHEQTRIPHIDIPLYEGDSYDFGGVHANILSVPGHTIGHIAFWFKDENTVFTGDSLMVMGCGRLFEGTAAMMFRSLEKFKEMPENTRVYSGHEYTLNNALFAQSLDEGDKNLKNYIGDIEQQRTKGEPTIPTTLEQELKFNPFMKAKDINEFAEIRRKKDQF